MAEKDLQTIGLKEQLDAERKLFMGKLGDDDKIPGSEMTLKEAREKDQQVVAEFNQQKVERALSVQKKNDERDKTDREIENQTQTRLVIPGVLVEVEQTRFDAAMSAAATVASTTTDLPPLPSDEELQATDITDLIILAGTRGVEGVKANVDDKDTIIAKLKGEYVESVDDDLEGKPRGDLEEIAKTELGIENADKTVYPNMTALKTAIRNHREQTPV